MSDINLTIKEAQVFKVITEALAEGLPPTVREICANTGIKSTSTVHRILADLEEKGYITRFGGNSRGIRIQGSAPSSQVPVLGKVTAGVPILAVEDIEEYIPFPVNSAEGLFGLRVSGLSMKDAGILDGDIIIADKNQPVRSGHIVVALIEDEATVKTFYKENGHFRLQPENSELDPIIIKEMTVLGRVIASIRFY